MTSGVKICPQCGSERSPSEFHCEGIWREAPCDWPLADVSITASGNAGTGIEVGTIPIPTAFQCINGHTLSPGDQICLHCGGEAAQEAQGSVMLPEGFIPEPAGGSQEISGDGRPREVDGWTLIRAIPAEDQPWERFLVSGGANGQSGMMTLYRERIEPDSAVQEALRRTHKDHIPELLATGRFADRAYEIIEHIEGQPLSEAGWLGVQDPPVLKRVVDELGRAIGQFAEMGLRHRDIQPRNILLRSRDPLDLVITSFGSARLSDYDLDSVAPLELSFYSAPETIVGAVSGASDWWSLGMLLLEQATQGGCFQHIHPKAFHIHVVTRGVEIPKHLAPELRLLLRGLLARDPLKRWGWPQVKAWLEGEPLDAPDESGLPATDVAGPTLTLGQKAFSRCDAFALAAAESQNWSAGRELVLRGAVATWLEALKDSKKAGQIRQLVSEEGLAEDLRHALCLMVLNASLPLTLQGDIITPGWLLEHPQEGYGIVNGKTAEYLDRMRRETWIVRLRARAQEVRSHARTLEIELDEERVRIALLTSSRANLEVERDRLRHLYPETDHAGLASILGRIKLSDEELIILISAATHQFLPLVTLFKNAEKLAERCDVRLDGEDALNQLVRPRRELFVEVEERIAEFSRCGIEKVDEWADAFRVERRLPLDKTVVLLATPKSLWQKPPKQLYLAKLLEVFEKRISGTVLRGPLTRFSIAKTTPRVDLVELGSALCPAEALLTQVLSRSEVPRGLDPDPLQRDEGLLLRFRRLVSHAQMFRRDSGIDGRYLGFPFLVLTSGKFGAQAGKKRLAPILLWPVQFEMKAGTGSATLQFDGEREEIRLNPALEILLGSEEFARWKAVREDIQARTSLRMVDILDAFAGLGTAKGRELSRLPGADALQAAPERSLICSAALFNAEFTGQAISEDLKRMRQRPAAGTGIEAVLRVQGETAVAKEPPNIPEKDRYLAVESDPSQEAAILMSRSAPGLLVEGPPGTGKSQTIVNIVADAIGRNETVLIVCQKQAALRVVQKRLEAEGLGERLFLVVDINRDREAVVKALREQVETVRRSKADGAVSLRRRREEIASRIETIEIDINRHHAALHAVDEVTGHTYRTLLGELIGLEADGMPISLPRLRPRFAQRNREQVSRIEEICAPLTFLWLQSGFEGSPLHALKPFAVDAATLAAFLEDFSAFHASEKERCEIFSRPTPSLVVNDPRPYRAWLKEHAPAVEAFSSEVRQSLSRWGRFFNPKADSGKRGREILSRLGFALDLVEKAFFDWHDDLMFPLVSPFNPDEIGQWVKVIRGSKATTFLERLSPARWLKRRKVTAFLKERRLDPTEERIDAFLKQLELEAFIAPARKDYKEILVELEIAEEKDPPTVRKMRSGLEALNRQLQPLPEAAGHVYACPHPRLAEAILQSASIAGCQKAKAEIESALERWGAMEASRSALAPLARWFEADWVEKAQTNIDAGGSSFSSLQDIQVAFDRLAAFQQFRTRAKEFDAEVMTIFATLRSVARDLEAVVAQHGPGSLEDSVRKVIRREAALAWKDRMEGERPELLYQREELAAKIRLLSELDEQIRKHNKTLLASDLDPRKLASLAEWESITRLRGPRMKRLREVLETGGELGLYHLRPIWLMNPEVASRILPLKGGFFDLVVYDEASQMPVEHAVPTLFRARRIVISGDEKQMPPTSFFSSRIDGDEDELVEGEAPEDDATEAEKAAHEESWNRREVKDCPDLLLLGHGVLPAATLQIHYRSRFRELIGFSNHAFYQGRLNIPVRHPDEKVLRVKPIEVIRVEGIYENQANVLEAERVVELLAGLWQVASATRPSIGVVTFNRKQADLIEDALEERGLVDAPFQLAHQEERERRQGGEDMGFFVKNVENVQGDERDIIIFSTTFGRDKQGAFRRNFGVLGQTGGERRLNVAITRAREKVFLITSIPVSDVSDLHLTGRTPAKPRDFLQAYLEYVHKLSAGNLALARGGISRMTSSNRESHSKNGEENGFMSSVVAYIRQLGYEPIHAHDTHVHGGDAFGIDLAILDIRTGLFGIGIECDSPRHELLSSPRAREIWRPKVLSRAIPRIHRVVSHAWYHQGDLERTRLREAIVSALESPEKQG